MALFDERTDEIVIRLVYGGPPLSGKTTNLKVLSGLVAERRRSALFTPAEADGRTLYFDWMDYLGGWVDGHAVRCQIVSVPGQRSLAGRRDLLIREADVVVLVVESSREGVEKAAHHLVELKPLLQRRGEPPVPVVLQANKQDLEGALSLDEIRMRFDGERDLAIVPSVAQSGLGVRESFTLAVRLALDRVRELVKEARLFVGQPSVRSGEELLAWIEAEEARGPLPARESPALEPESVRSLGASAPEPPGALPAVQPVAPVSAVPNSPEALPAPPDSKIPSGLVWPPVSGRIVLHGVERGSLRLRRLEAGAWLGLTRDAWRMLSAPDEVFGDVEEGRARLIEYARLHAKLQPILSERRAIVLAVAGDRRWRLWRLLRSESSLRDDLVRAVSREGARPMAVQLVELAGALLVAADLFRKADAPFSAGLRSVGVRDGGLCHIGFVDLVHREPAGAEAGALITREFGRELRRLRGRLSIDVPALLIQLREVTNGDSRRAELFEGLAAALIEL